MRSNALVLTDTVYANRIMIAVLIMSVGGALAIYMGGLLAVPVAVASLIPVLVLYFGYRMFALGAFTVLFGMMFAGKGFAYIGYNPIFISELVIALGVLCLVLIPFSDRLKIANNFLNPIFIPLLLFLVWELYRTLPFVTTYRIDAIRDAFLYLYAIYAFLWVLLIPKKSAAGFIELYGYILPIYLFTSTLIFLLSYTFESMVPRLPGAPVGIISQKPGDGGVHLGCAMAYVMLRLDRYNKKPFSQTLIWLMWLAWGITWLLYGSVSRGGMISALTAIGIVFILRPQSGWYRPVIIAVCVISFLLMTGLYSTLEIDFGYSRKLSAEQLVNNMMSIFGEGDDDQGGLEETKQWRVNWWNTIIDYTFYGDYFWTGKGFGINLALADEAYPEETVEAKGTRNPHNSHLAILARSGVPGLVLWIVFLVAFLLMMLRKTIVNDPSQRARRDSRYAIWILACVCAHLVNASFDVYLEGPMGGVWLWSLIGLGFIFCTRQPSDSDPDVEREIVQRVSANTPQAAA